MYKLWSWDISSDIPRHLGNSYFFIYLFIGFNCTPISEYHPKLKVLKTKDSSTGFFKKLVKDLLLFGIVLYYKKNLLNSEAILISPWIIFLFSMKYSEVFEFSSTVARTSHVVCHVFCSFLFYLNRNLFLLPY